MEDEMGWRETVAEEAERSVRIFVWNFLRDRGWAQDRCYPVIEGAATSFRAALPHTSEGSNG